MSKTKEEEPQVDMATDTAMEVDEEPTVAATVSKAAADGTSTTRDADTSTPEDTPRKEPFYLRYYSGHSGRFGHEFLEFDFLDDGSARYANNSNYRSASLIRKEFSVSPLVISELRRIVVDSEILREDDSRWPRKNRDGRQELEIRLGNDHVSFELAKIGSLTDVQESDDPEGLRVFYYLVQDIKAFCFSLISLHFKVSLSFDPRHAHRTRDQAIDCLHFHVILVSMLLLHPNRSLC